MGDVVSIWTSKKAKCQCCNDLFRPPGFGLNDEGICVVCEYGLGEAKRRADALKEKR